MAPNAKGRKQAGHGRYKKHQEPKKDEAPPHLVRGLNKALKKAKVFQLRKCIRKGESDDSEVVNQQVSFLKSLRPNELTRELIESIGGTIPRKIELEWKAAANNQQSETTTKDDSNSKVSVKLPEPSQQTTLKNQIVTQSGVAQSLSLIKKMIQANNSQLAETEREARKVIECTEVGCSAKFSSEEGRNMHMRRRHGDTETHSDNESKQGDDDDNKKVPGIDSEDEDEEAVDGDIAVSVSKEDVEEINKMMGRDNYFDTHDPFDDDAAKPKRKNRMGQRERKRQAIMRERREAMEARQQGLPAPPKHKRPQVHEDGEGDTKRPRMDKATSDRRKKAEDVLDEPKKKDKEVLHPSWEAMKQLKNPAIVPFKGKKITFGEDSDED